MCFELLTRMLENKPPSSLSQLTLSLHLNLTCWCVFSFCFLKTHQGLQKPSKCCLIGLWGRGGHRLSGKERIMNYYWDFIFLILWKLWMKEQVAALCWVLGRHDRWGNECRKGREVKDRVRQAIHGKWGGGTAIFPISSTCVVVRKLISTVDSRMSGLVLGPSAVCWESTAHGPCCFWRNPTHMISEVPTISFNLTSKYKNIIFSSNSFCQWTFGKCLFCQGNVVCNEEVISKKKNDWYVLRL